MSGGSHNYFYLSVQNEYGGQFEDSELNDLLDDYVVLLHDLEWYHSGDTGKDTYMKAVAKFKQKWFKSDRHERLISYIDDAVKKLRKELIDMVGG